MNDDESLALLREIRDILNDQTKLVTEQHADSVKRARRGLIVSWVCGLAASGLLLYLLIKLAPPLL